MWLFSKASVTALLMSWAYGAFGYPEGPPLLYAPRAGDDISAYSSQYVDPGGLYARTRLESTLSNEVEPDTARETLIVTGHAQGFLNLSSVPPEEITCIREGSLPLTTALLGSSRQIVDSAKAINSSLAVPNASSLDNRRAQLRHKLSHGLHRMLSTIHAVTRTCALGIELRGLMGDETEGLVTSVGDELQIRGVVVGPELSAAVWAWDAQDMRHFGQLIGSVWRKVLLSETLTDGSGPPSDEAVRGMSSGLVEGFFGENSFDETARQARARSDSTDVKLRKCVTYNLPFFEVVWSATALVLKDMAKHNTSSVSSEKEDLDLRTSIAQALVRFPSALSRCGVQNREEFALVDALEALVRMHFTIDRSSRNVHTVDISIDLSQFVQDWTAHQWWDVGFRLGQLLQQMVVMTFPMKYSSDASGRLRHVSTIIQPRIVILVYMILSAFVAILLMASMVKWHFLCTGSPENEDNSQSLPIKSQYSDIEEAID